LINPISPILLIISAFKDALPVVILEYQKLISKLLDIPITSHNMNVINISFESITIHIDKKNILLILT